MLSPKLPAYIHCLLDKLQGLSDLASRHFLVGGQFKACGQIGKKGLPVTLYEMTQTGESARTGFRQMAPRIAPQVRMSARPEVPHRETGRIRRGWRSPPAAAVFASFPAVSVAVALPRT